MFLAKLAVNWKLGAQPLIKEQWALEPKIKNEKLIFSVDFSEIS
jgi:hypothetical protein